MTRLPDIIANASDNRIWSLDNMRRNPDIIRESSDTINRRAENMIRI